MAQYPRVAMPQAQPIDLLGSLGDIMRFAAQSRDQAYRERGQEREEAKYQRKLGDQNAVDRAFSPQAAMGDLENNGQGTPDWQGPTNDQYSAPPRTRERVLGSLPGHLKPVVQKMFDEEDTRWSQKQKARFDLKAAQTADQERTNDWVGYLGKSILATGGTREATQNIIDLTRERYAEDAEGLAAVNKIIGEYEKSPTPEVALRFGQALLSVSPKYAKEWKEEQKVTELELLRVASGPPGPQQAAAQAVLDKKSEEAARNRPQGSPEQQFMAEQDPTKRAALLAGRSQWTQAGKDPDKPDTSAADKAYSRNRQDYTDFKAVWNKQHASGPKLGENGIPEYDEMFNPIMVPYEPPPTFDEWLAQRQPRPVPLPALPEQRLSPIPAPGAVSGAPAVQQMAPPAAALASTPRYRVGQKIKLSTGQTITIKEVSPDGTKFR